MNGERAARPARRPGWALGVLTLILVVAAVLRLRGLNWDEGQLFHPDERWIIVVAADLYLPETLADLAPSGSPLNPFWDQEAGRPQRFAYGHFPLYLLRLVGAAVAPLAPDPLPTRYEYLALVGRLLAVAADLVTIVLTYVLGRRLFRVGVGLLAAAGVALATLHVQLAHFYTVDPLLTALVMGALLAMTAVAERGSLQTSLLAGAATGLAVGTKSSAVALVFPLVLAHAIDGFDAEQQARLRSLWRGPGRGRAALDLWNGLDSQRGWRWLLPALGTALLAFGVTNPYALADPVQFVSSVGAQSRMVQGSWVLPYTEQYRGTWPYLYFVAQQVHWFLGPALGFLAWSGFGWLIWRLVRGATHSESASHFVQSNEWPAVAWAVPYFALTGAFFVKFPRYLAPLTPLLLIWGVALLFSVTRHRLRWRVAVAALIFGPTVVYALAFTSIYSQRHPWIQASEWIYRHVPPGAAIVVELWDHPLPVSMDVDGTWHRGREYQQIMIDPYDTETPDKESQLAQSLNEADWVVLSSPRGWGVLRRLGREYPLMPTYYEGLLTGHAGFEIAGLWRVEPRLGPIALGHNPFVSALLPTPAAWHAAAPAPWTVDLGFADESFRVYDHPMPIILRKRQSLEVDELRARLWPASQAREVGVGSEK